MNALFAAIRFLTILPLPGKRGNAECDLVSSLWFFPVVGILVGTVVAVTSLGLAPFLPKGLNALLAVGLLLAVSGGLHLDGLADCADGFFSSRPRARILEIMRDSHVGVMGVVALFLVLGAKWVAIGELPLAQMGKALFLAPVAGRCSMVMMMAILPYARSEGGLATLFYSARSRGPALWSAVVLICVSWASGETGLWSIGAVLLTLLCFVVFCSRKIGGATGDTLGACSELAETAVLIGFSLSPPV
ncbi:MAG: adenosylcobinamide-GDP ribazoletransferase [Proteobacteria bacterium]|nr:adenosylcobinamide-GDP ribazoletransferase [Pseudomonadota bacterium]MBU1687133.1 adenosylcobinamide-GDP ribazoletransferase [Pseudomonadota bacterium]